MLRINYCKDLNIQLIFFLPIIMRQTSNNLFISYIFFLYFYIFLFFLFKCNNFTRIFITLFWVNKVKLKNIQLHKNKYLFKTMTHRVNVWLVDVENKLLSRLVLFLLDNKTIKLLRDWSTLYGVFKFISNLKCSIIQNSLFSIKKK